MGFILRIYLLRTTITVLHMPTAATVKSSHLKPYSQAAVLSEYSTL